MDIKQELTIKQQKNQDEIELLKHKIGYFDDIAQRNWKEHRGSALDKKQEANNLRVRLRELEVEQEIIQEDLKKLLAGEKLPEIQKERATEASEVLHQHFDLEERKLCKSRKRWQFATMVLGAFTIVTTALLTFLILYSDFIHQKVADSNLLALSLLTSKLITLSFLFYATIWCSRIYLALRHQQTIYKNKSIVVRTFLSFRNSALSEKVQDAVLAEAVRNIFSENNTGFLSVKGENNVNIFEIFKHASKS